MLVYFCTRAHMYPPRYYLQGWGKELAEQFQLFCYEWLSHKPLPAADTYLFSDLERLTPQLTRAAVAVYERLSQRGARLLNHPRQSLRRYDLLCALHQAGINTFRPYRVPEMQNARLPLIFRDETEHQGPMTQPLHTDAEIQKFLRWLRLQKEVVRNNTIAIEFVDISVDGLFRKYSAFYLGGEVVPRNMICSKQWMQKYPDILSPEVLAEEREYLQTNPHREQIERAFRLAKLDYGRIDYGLLQGRPQIWEINTNPIIMQLPEKYPLQHLAAQDEFHRLVFPHMAALCGPLAAGSAVSDAPA